MVFASRCISLLPSPALLFSQVNFSWPLTRHYTYLGWPPIIPKQHPTFALLSISLSAFCFRLASSKKQSQVNCTFSLFSQLFTKKCSLLPNSAQFSSSLWSLVWLPRHIETFLSHCALHICSWRRQHVSSYFFLNRWLFTKLSTLHQQQSWTETTWTCNNMSAFIYLFF